MRCASAALDQRDLVGGDLISDLLAAIKLDRPEIMDALAKDTTTAKNAAPGWKTLELIREVHRASGGLRSNRGLRRQDQFKGIRKAASRIRRSGEAVAEDLGLGTGRAQYVTVEQWRACRAQYVADLRRLNACMGHQIPEPNSPEPPERPFLPSAEAVPAEERGPFNERMLFELIPYIALGTKDEDEATDPSEREEASGVRASDADGDKAERQAAKQALRATKRKQREERQGANSKRQFKNGAKPSAAD